MRRSKTRHVYFIKEPAVTERIWDRVYNVNSSCTCSGYFYGQKNAREMFKWHSSIVLSHAERRSYATAGQTRYCRRMRRKTSLIGSTSASHHAHGRQRKHLKSNKPTMKMRLWMFNLPSGLHRSRCHGIRMYVFTVLCVLARHEKRQRHGHREDSFKQMHKNILEAVMRWDMEWANNKKNIVLKAQ